MNLIPRASVARSGYFTGSGISGIFFREVIEYRSFKEDMPLLPHTLYHVTLNIHFFLKFAF